MSSTNIDSGDDKLVMHDKGGVSVQTDKDGRSTIGRDVAGRDIVTNITPDWTGLYQSARQGEVAALAEMMRMILERLERLEQSAELIASLIDAVKLSTQQGAATAESIHLLRREVNLKAAIEQQIDALKSLQ